MKWEPKECHPGDMIRVRLGALYHYGIFVSENEIIQFGLPPTAENRAAEGEVVVLATNIDVFSCGCIIETACLERGELKKRFPPEETIRKARSRLGEGGYDLIHHNCEHFVNECIFGISRCSQEEEVRKRWANQRICDVYLSAVTDAHAIPDTLPEKLLREIQAFRQEEERRRVITCWRLMSIAAERSFHTDLSKAGLKRKLSGKWVCSSFHFSMSSTGSVAAVAVSNEAVILRTDTPDGDVVKTLREPEIPVSISGKNAAAARYFWVENDFAALLGKKRFM